MRNRGFDAPSYILGANRKIAEAVTDWLDEHVDPETGYVLDNSLTIEGAAADAKAVGDAIASAQAKAKPGTITLSATWSGSDPYTQTVTVTGAMITANSQISLQPTAAQLAQMISDGVTALVIENNAGVLTATALGAAISVAMTVACTVTEVSA